MYCGASEVTQVCSVVGERSGTGCVNLSADHLLSLIRHNHAGPSPVPAPDFIPGAPSFPLINHKEVHDPLLCQPWACNMNPECCQVPSPSLCLS
jgi:hypothetical protein